MDTPKVSQMWKILQEANKLPQSRLLAGAEDELQELMKQIDIMVQSRKAEWEREKQALLARLDIKEKEHFMQASTLEEKYKEIGELRAQLQSVEQSHRDATAEYEKQLSGLREQIAHMKKEFEKLHRRYSKKAKQAEADHQRKTSEHGSEELKQLNTKIEEFKKKAKDWEKKRRDYEEQIAVLQKDKSLLQEARHQKKDSDNPAEGDIRTFHEDFAAENQQLHTSLAHKEQRIIQLQKELRELRSESEMTQNIIADQRTLISKLEQSLKHRNTINRTSNAEREYEKQVAALQKRISDLLKEKESLALQLQNKTDERKEYELKNMQKYSTELSKLKANQLTLEEAHESEVFGLKDKISSLTEELHEKVILITKLNEQLSASEKKLNECVQLLNRTEAELQVAQAQRDALRLENQNLRHLILSRQGIDVDVHDAECHLNELQKAYTASLTSLETQNRKLSSELSTLKCQLSSLESNQLEKSERMLNESQRSIQELQDTEQKKILELEKKYKKEMQAIQEKLNTTVQKYESQIEALRSEMSIIQEELELQNQSVKRSDVDHRVLTKFVTGARQLIDAVDHHGNSEAVSHNNIDASNSLNSRSTDTPVEGDGNLEDDLLTDTVEAARIKFLEEQKARTQQLEEQLDTHIQYLRESTNETIRKHSTKSH